MFSLSLTQIHLTTINKYYWELLCVRELCEAQRMLQWKKFPAFWCIQLRRGDGIKEYLKSVVFSLWICNFELCNFHIQNTNFEYVSELLQDYRYSFGIFFCAITDPLQLVLLTGLCIHAGWKVGLLLSEYLHLVCSRLIKIA